MTYEKIKTGVFRIFVSLYVIFGAIVISFNLIYQPHDTYHLFEQEIPNIPVSLIGGAIIFWVVYYMIFWIIDAFLDKG